MSFQASIDGVLRGEGPYASGRGRVPWVGLMLLVVLGGFVYGACMGSFALRPVQALYSALKVPLLLALTTLVCLPSFYAMNTILGLRNDFVPACRGLFASQATAAVCLASLAPITLFGYGSSDNYRFAVVLNGLCFLAAALAGQATLGRHYAPLVRTDAKHHLTRILWLVLYVFVAIQLAWLLRPFVGDPDLAPRFLREDAWNNAYVIVARTIWELFTSP